MKHSIPFHPALLPIFPILNYWLINRDFIAFHDTWRTLFTAILATLLLFVMASALLKSTDKGAALASLVSVFFLFFGQVYFSLRLAFPRILSSSSFFFAWGCLFLSGAWLIIRARKVHPILTDSLNLVSVLLLAPVAFGAVQALSEYHTLRHPEADNIASAAAMRPTKEPLPDIYYIILDSYGRGDVLSDLYGWDNSEFLEGLRQRGFYVAGQSQANYMQTPLALSAALNGNYLDPAQFEPDWTNRLIFRPYLDTTPNLERLKELGYEVLSTENAVEYLELDVSDKFLAPHRSFDGFALTFNRVTFGSIWSPNLYEHALWEITRDQLDALEDPSLGSGPPHFVFSHIMSPHPPFSFDEQGNYTKIHPDPSMGNGPTAAEREQYMTGYRAQFQYLNRRITRIIDSIQSDPERPAIIILQADHGPAAYLDNESPDRSCLRERFSILNAYYFPDAATRARLYPSITPVNSFRILLGDLVGKPIPLLPDRSYYSTKDRPYAFVDVTGSAKTCSPLEK